MNKDIEEIKREAREEIYKLASLGNDGNIYYHPEKLDTIVDKAVSQTIKMVLDCKPEEKKLDKDRTTDERRYPHGFNAALQAWQIAINKLKDK